MTDPNNTVTFSLSEPLLASLRAEASKYGLSPEELSRLFVLDRLEQRSQQRTADEIVELRRDLGKLRVDLAILATVMLVGAGRLELEEAQNWVRENLRP